MGGHSDICAGAVAASDEHIRKIWNLAKNLGGSLSDYTVWLLERSMKTMVLRVKAQNKNAKKLARWLEKHPWVEKVYYPRLKSHPDHQLAKKQMKGYTGMLSFHDTKDVIVENLLLEDSKIYDDAIHIIYSSLIINNCQINNAFADAIDIDISSVIIKQCKIFNSGNDGIDSMSSRVSVSESDISYSGDKGISVGEGSDLNVISTSLKENFIGIENKDNSKTRVYKSDLIDNQMQINSYLKNWQYGGGGKIFVLDSNILPIKDKVENDKNTETFFFDERYSNKQFKQNKNIFFLNENSEVFNMKGITEEQIRSEINFNNNFNYYESAKEN